MRPALDTLLLASLLVCASPTGEARADGDAPHVNVAYHPNLHGASIVALALEKGWFEEAGIEVRARKFTSGPPEIEAMNAGEIDLGFIGTGALPLAMQGPFRVVAIDLIGMAEEVLAHPDSGIDSVAALRGKRVVTTQGTSGEMILRVALADAGLAWTDVDMRYAPPESAVSAFVAGKVDAVALWQPLTNQIRKDVPEARLLASGKDLFPRRVFPILWIAREEFVAERPDLLRRFLAASRRAIDYRREHLDETIDLVARFAKVPRDILEAQRDSARFLSSEELDVALRDGTATRWFEDLNRLFIDMGRIADVRSVDSYVVASHFIEAPSELAKGPAAPREENGLGVVQVLSIIAGALFVGGLVLWIRHARS